MEIVPNPDINATIETRTYVHNGAEPDKGWDKLYTWRPHDATRPLHLVTFCSGVRWLRLGLLSRH